MTERVAMVFPHHGGPDPYLLNPGKDQYERWSHPSFMHTALPV